MKSEASVSNSVTVRHVPLTAMLSPRLTPSRTVFALTFKSKPPSGDAPICFTVPISSTRPVKRHWTETTLVRRLIGLRVEWRRVRIGEGLNRRLVIWERWDLWWGAEAILGVLVVKVMENEEEAISVGFFFTV